MDGKILDRDFCKKVAVNVVSALVIGAIFYMLVGVFGFKWPKGASVTPGIAS